MTSAIIGIKTFDGEKERDFIDFHAIEERIKSKIKNGSMIREQTDEKQNYKDINKQFFGGVLYNIYNNCYGVLEILIGFCIWKTLGKMVIEKTFSYNTEKELNKIYENVVYEIISDIKNKNNYYIFLKHGNEEYIDCIEFYPKIIDKFNNYIKKHVCKDKESDNFERSFIQFFKRRWMIYLKDTGIIHPIQCRKFS